MDPGRSLQHRSALRRACVLGARLRFPPKPYTETSQRAIVFIALLQHYGPL